MLNFRTWTLKRWAKRRETLRRRKSSSFACCPSASRSRRSRPSWPIWSTSDFAPGSPSFSSGSRSFWIRPRSSSKGCFRPSSRTTCRRWGASRTMWFSWPAMSTAGSRTSRPRRPCRHPKMCQNMTEIF